MTGDIRDRLERQPFIAFTINMADGRKIRVPTRDHIAISQPRVVVMHDDGTLDLLPGLLISGLTIDQPAQQPE